MTLVSDIINDAFRQGNLIAVGTVPSANEIAEALRYINRIVKSVLGNEVGEPLKSFPLGRVDITRPSQYPLWDTNPGVEWVVPPNTRLTVNLSANLTVYLHPMPDDGARFAVSDAVGTLGANTLTVEGNGRSIEGALSVAINTAKVETEWVFRADTGNWHKVSPLIATDVFPFPEEFDDFFIVLLAMKINPSYGLQLDQQAQQMMSRARTQLRARYKQYMPSPSPLALRRLGYPRYFDMDQPGFGDYPGRWGLSNSTGW